MTEYDIRVMQTEEKLAAAWEELEKTIVESEKPNLMCALLQ